MKILKHTVWLLLLLLLSSGCFGTIAPKSAKAKQASFSDVPDPTGNFQTSGIWGFTPSKEMVIDHVARDGYNTLIEQGWGTRLMPPATNRDYGLKPYTNNPVEPLRTLRGNITKPVPNPGGLWDANPLAQEALGVMKVLSTQPIPAPSRPP